MKSLFLFIFLISCSSLNSNYNVKKETVDFNKELSFDEFKKLLIKYTKKNPYPNIDQ